PGGLGGTFGGNPVACAAALGAIRTLEEQDLVGAARRIGAVMLARLCALQRRYPVIGDVRGRGAMMAVELVLPGTTTPDPATTLADALRRRKLSAVEALEAVLRRADEIAGPVNPFTVRLDHRARRAAMVADQALAQGAGGPLCGVPASTKDSHWLAGVPSTSG